MKFEQALLLTGARLFDGLKRRLRRLYYSRVLKAMGEGCEFCDGVLVTCPEHISLGNKVVLNENAVLQSCDSAEIILGDCVVMSYNSMLLTGGLDLGETGPKYEDHKSTSITVGSGAWIGAGAIVLPGVTLGAGAVVAAGSVVRSNVAAFTLVGGVPAKFLRAFSGPSA